MNYQGACNEHERTYPPPQIRGSAGKRLLATLAAALVALVVAAPAWAHSGDATVWLEYKGTQVLCAYPGEASTAAAVNVEAFGGFFEPGTDVGLKHARVAFSPSDLLEYRVGPDGGWADLGMLPDGQLRISLKKGDNLIHFRQKVGARMPTGGRRNIRVNLLASCSDCRGAPGGPAISSNRQTFGYQRPVEPYTVGEGANCRSSDHTRAFSHYNHTDCRVRVRDGETYRYVGCTYDNLGTWCNAVPNRVGSPVCTREARYTCSPPPNNTRVTNMPNAEHYRVKNTGAIFNVQYDSDYCM